VFKNMGDVLKQAQQMQAKMQALREELRQREVVGSAGGGLVTIALNGTSEPLRVKIDPKLAGDMEMLEDLVLAALRDAQQKVQELVQQEMGHLAGPIAGAFGLPGT
jgi:nucleoid-associated protein EbfC